MSVTTVTKVSSTGGIDEEGHQTFIVTYRVVTDDANDGPWTVLQGAGLARWGDVYQYGNDYNPWAFARRMGDASLQEQDGSKKVWLVPVTYSTRWTGREASSNKLAGNPLDEPWTISGSYIQLTKSEAIDKDGNLVMNSALEIKAFDIPYGHDTLTLSGPTATISLSTRALAKLKCNSVPIWGLSERQLLLRNWQYEVRWYGTSNYVHHTLNFEINYDGWSEFWVDYGTRQADLSVNPPDFYPYKDRNGRYLSSFPLDGNGLFLDLTATNAVPYINESKLIKEYDFTTLGLPNPLPGPFV